MNSYPLLESLDHPQDLKHFSIEQLQALAKELRKRIVSVMSINGGHLASNLGIVELTVALHKLFDSPKDRFVFDVSHQTYSHKLLTGRNTPAFDDIRKSGGLNGFSHPTESEHDHFFAGHAGTSLSLSLGLAHARDLAKSSEYILSIIGDATLSCGLSFEALNNLPYSMGKFLILLNDNEMSISENVGNFEELLKRKRKQPLIREFSVSYFSSLDIPYCGPIDGHDLPSLLSILEKAKDLNHPLLLHIVTKKGYGIKEAEEDPVNYHGAKPFDPKTCKFIPNPSQAPTFPKIFGKKLENLGEKHSNLVTVTPAMSHGSCLEGFKAHFPKRFFDVGIAEGHCVTFSGGLAKYHDLKVICSIYSTFLHRALDNLFQDVALQKLPVIFAIDRAGLAFGDGATHHGIYETAFLKTQPGMVICQPRDGQLLEELLECALEWNSPCAIRYPNINTKPASQPLKKRPLGKGEVLIKEHGVLLVTLGHMQETGYKVHAELAKKGIPCSLVDPIFIKPFDEELLNELLFTHSVIVTIEELALSSGIACEVNRTVAHFGLEPHRVLNFGIPDSFFDHGSKEELYKKAGITVEQIVPKIEQQWALQIDKERVNA